MTDRDETVTGPLPGAPMPAVRCADEARDGNGVSPIMHDATENHRGGIEPSHGGARPRSATKPNRDAIGDENPDSDADAENDPDPNDDRDDAVGRGRRKRPGRRERQLRRLEEENRALRRQLDGASAGGESWPSTPDDPTQAAKQARAVRAAFEGLRASREAGRAKFQAFMDRCGAVRSRHSDFDAVVFDPATPIMPTLARLVIETEDGPELAYHLAKNRDEAIRLSRMPPARAAHELGRIAARLTAPPSRKATRAPAPVRTLGGGSATGGGDPEQMNMAEYRAYRGFARKRR